MPVPAGTEGARPFPPPRAPKALALQPWGLRIRYMVDPAGVRRHVAERRAGAVQD